MPEPARKFGRYVVTGTLGSGAMGEVFAAVDDVLGREVAIKTLKAHANGLAARMLDERFRLEARAVAALAHPGVVHVYDLDLTADPPYLVMERVAGPSLKERIGAPMPVSELRGLGIQIARALAAAHDRGIVHRDVKPANILAAGAGTWKLADFGVAHVPDSSLTMTGQFVGSPAYAPPEALVRGQCDAAGDVFGLGATLYHAAVGRWPRLEATTAALLAPIPSIGPQAPHLPPDLAALIDRAVAIEPTQRPSAAQLADALAAVTATADRTPVPAPLSSIPAGLGASPHESSTSGAGVLAPVEMAHAVTLPGAVPPVRGARWKAWGAIAGLVLVTILIARSSSDDPPRSGRSASPGFPEDRGTLTGPIEVATPAAAMQSKGAAKSWNKILKALSHGDVGEALDKLEEFEHEHGASAETAALRQQLGGPTHALPWDRD